MPRRPHARPGTKLFIGNLCPDTTDFELASAAAHYGELEEAIVLERLSERGHRCGFIRYTDSFGAELAKAGLEGTDRLGNGLMVRHADRWSNRSKARSSSPPTFTPLIHADPLSPIGLTELTQPATPHCDQVDQSLVVETEPTEEGSPPTTANSSTDTTQFFSEPAVYRRDPYTLSGWVVGQPSHG